jgi:hypothetical protein
MFFLANGDVCEEFVVDEHDVGSARNRSTSSFCVVDYHKGYMVLVHAGDEGHSKRIWLVKVLSSPNLFQLAPIFVKFKWNIVAQELKPKCNAHLIKLEYQEEF